MPNRPEMQQSYPTPAESRFTQELPVNAESVLPGICISQLTLCDARPLSIRAAHPPLPTATAAVEGYHNSQAHCRIQLSESE